MKKILCTFVDATQASLYVKDTSAAELKQYLGLPPDGHMGPTALHAAGIRMITFTSETSPKHLPRIYLNTPGGRVGFEAACTKALLHQANERCGKLIREADYRRDLRAFATNLLSTVEGHVSVSDMTVIRQAARKVGIGPAETFSHAYTLAFSVDGSTHAEGEDVTTVQMVAALEKRIKNLVENDEMLEATGAPYDTYKE